MYRYLLHTLKVIAPPLLHTNLQQFEMRRRHQRIITGFFLGSITTCLFVSSFSNDERDRIADSFATKHIENDQFYKPLSRDDAIQDYSHLDYKPRSTNNVERDTQQMNRIIGGQEADVGRYSYIASLTHERAHICGGSLIADDIILSAAHCAEHIDGVDLGRHDLTDKTENKERFNIDKFLQHPTYKDAAGSFDNDFLVIKLFGWSSDGNVARINSNPNIPQNQEEVYVAGWGVVNTDTDKTADRLKEVSVNYMTNDVCRSKKGNIQGYNQMFSLSNKISGNMMCALDDGEDSCQGDSGGPLVRKHKTSAQLDVQVGVVSWGLGCADAVFPGIYARISSQYQWIRNIVCAWAENPPESYNCPPRPQAVEKSKRKVTMDIRLDRFPQETGWLIRSEYGKTHSYVSIGKYSAFLGKPSKDKNVITIVDLDEDTRYELIMLDSYGDGFKFDGGYYKLWLGDTPYAGIELIAGSHFGKFIIHSFYVPKNIANKAPTPSPEKQEEANYPVIDDTPSPTAPEPDPYITIAFKFDQAPEQIGWAVTSIESEELLGSKQFGSYVGKKNSIISEKLTLPLPNESGNEGDQYVFAILDSGRDGLCCEKGQGFVQVFYGGIDDGVVMFRGGSFKYMDQFIFDYNGTVVKSPTVYLPPRLDGEYIDINELGRFPILDDIFSNMDDESDDSDTSGFTHNTARTTFWSCLKILMGTASILVCIFG